MKAAELATRLALEVRSARESGDAIVLADTYAAEPVKRVARSVNRIEHAPRPRSRSSSAPLSGGFVVTLPPAPRAAVRGHEKAVLGLAAVGLGLAAVALLTRRAAHAAALPPGSPVQPSPTPPSATPPPSSSSPPSSTKPPEKPPEPTPAPAPAPGEPIADWRKSGPLKLVTLNSLTGYHRAKTSEVGPQMRSAAASFLKAPVGSLHFVELDGKAYAVALEEHTNHPELGQKNKGVSIFAKDGA